tara:strand:+ start:1204 stop:1653 length:450 start_codon:yes stop_codon:yes gene_type:complete
MNKKIVCFDSIYDGEYAIQDLIKNDNNCSAHFQYSHHPPRGYELVVMTYNPSHKTAFFLHSLYAETQKKALENMYDHIFNLKTTLKEKDSPYLNYTVEWYNSKEKKRIKSTFFGKSIQEVISKFFYGKYGKEAEKTPIYSIILNPNAVC